MSLHRPTHPRARAGTRSCRTARPCGSARSVSRMRSLSWSSSPICRPFRSSRFLGLVRDPTPEVARELTHLDPACAVGFIGNAQGVGGPHVAHQEILLVTDIITLEACACSSHRHCRRQPSRPPDVKGTWQIKYDRRPKKVSGTISGLQQASSNCP